MNQKVCMARTGEVWSKPTQNARTHFKYGYMYIYIYKQELLWTRKADEHAKLSEDKKKREDVKSSFERISRFYFLGRCLLISVLILIRCMLVTLIDTLSLEEVGELGFWDTRFGIIWWVAMQTLNSILSIHFPASSRRDDVKISFSLLHGSLWWNKNFLLYRRELGLVQHTHKKQNLRLKK